MKTTYWLIQKKDDEYLVFKNGELFSKSSDPINLRRLSDLSNSHITVKFGVGLFEIKNIIPYNCSIIGSGYESTIVRPLRHI